MYCLALAPSFHFLFFNDTATTEIYTLSLHDALPIFRGRGRRRGRRAPCRARARGRSSGKRSEEHTSELQSHLNLVCRLLLEKITTAADQVFSIRVAEMIEVGRRHILCS